MSAVNFYPGPLRQERTWWLGIGLAGGSDHVQTEWTQSYHLFNPGGRKVSVDLTFLGLKRRRRPLVRSVELPSGGVARIESPDIRGLPFHQPFAVRAEGDRPFCAQVFTRAGTRGLPHTRAMYSSMGTPMALER
jgi:hypothetical protein